MAAKKKRKGTKKTTKKKTTTTTTTSACSVKPKRKRAAKRGAKKSAKRGAKKGGKRSAKKRVRAHRGKSHGKHTPIATGLPPVKKGTLHFQKGTTLFEAKLTRGAKKGHRAPSARKGSRTCTKK